MSDRVLEVAGVDDFINRRYLHSESRQVVDLYVGYTTHPASMMGHRPDVCYPTHGWARIATKEVRLPLPNGKELTCNISEFARHQPVYQGTVVLNYYTLQGRHTAEWTDFWGPKWRMPNLSRDASFYVAQVEISSGFMDPGLSGAAEQVVKRFAGEVAVAVDSLLPGTEAARQNQVN